MSRSSRRSPSNVSFWDSLRRNEALVVQAALFSVVHLLPLVFVSHFVFGLLLGQVRRWTKSLYPCVALHALWNASVFAGELLSGPR